MVYQYPFFEHDIGPLWECRHCYYLFEVEEDRE